MANAKDIESYHEHLLIVLNKEGLLGQIAVIRAAPRKDWKDPKFKGEIDFDLWPTESPMTAKSAQGSERAIFAFQTATKVGTGELMEVGRKGESGICWISWHERWERLAPEGGFQARRRSNRISCLGPSNGYSSGAEWTKSERFR